MIYLLIVSILWAFSFGLIKGNLVSIDSNFVSFARLFISFLVFLPFLRMKNLNRKIIYNLIFIGAMQYGIMYITYIYSFQFLKAYEVVLFTIFTPVYVVLINDLIMKKLHTNFYITALLSLAGAAIVVWHEISSTNLIIGFMLMQISNLSFAFGQVYYKKLMIKHSEIKDKNIYSFLFLGGFLLAFVFSLFTTDYSLITLNKTEIYTLLYLGAVASGIGFFLWNYGAKLTNIGSLAIFNNLKIPLGILVSVIFFSEEVNIWNLLIGGLLVTIALLINEYQIKKHLSQTKRI
ncbi:MAG: EamA family transporter [Bacteroidetes bacterium]|nr:EamA family transporter [Bacteroidota bacterium]MBU1113641.1 EamA family transporter [Bacteroidota bacterium]MBU1796783.1 EamA family transporter [Bacteroidota bacterium]